MIRDFETLRLRRVATTKFSQPFQRLADAPSFGVALRRLNSRDPFIKSIHPCVATRRNH